jgi:hypothetical protein
MKRAHISHALRWQASETLFGVGEFPVTDTVASAKSGGEFTGARPGLPASIFGKCSGVLLFQESPAT